MGNQEPELMISCLRVLFWLFFSQLQFNHLCNGRKKIGEGFMMAVKKVLILITNLPVAPS